MFKLAYSSLLLLPRKHKRLVMVVADLLLIPLALWCAFALRLGDASFAISPYYLLFIFAPLVCVPIFYRLGLYRAVIRYMGDQAAMSVIKGVTFTTIALMIFVVALRMEAVPRSVYAIFWLIAVLYVGGSRFFVRSYYQWLVRSYSERQVVAIYGAGSAGVQLAAALDKGDEYFPVAFIDDNKALCGSSINGLQVYSFEQIESRIDDLKITQVLLAMPSVSHAKRQLVINRLEPLPVHVKTVPSMPDLVLGNLTLDEIQDVDIEDLLGRDTVLPDEKLLKQNITHKTIVVTGAAGSIGSELCRQIVLAKPQRLLLLDLSEFGLYSIEREIRSMVRDENIDIIPILCSVQNQPSLERIFSSYQVDIVFHAAAYKHVPIVEHNIISGIRNNIFGTLAVARAASKEKVKSVILISTDKAVRPTNVMGATKRLAELIFQGIATEHQETCFSMVRFGNVLGSSGSVVPLFRSQIEQGGPVTVTHPEVTRYFMTIPEAAQLVIQSGAIAQGGDVFVLDMGEPVKIVDLAKKMIHLMGFEVIDDKNPNGDIEIVYTGLRPGEKLIEELLISGTLTGTEKNKIFRTREVSLPWAELEKLLKKLDQACDEFDQETIRDILLHGIVGFKPQHEFVDAFLQNAGNKAKKPTRVAQIHPPTRT